jgi:hypothetical protein
MLIRQYGLNQFQLTWRFSFRYSKLQNLFLFIPAVILSGCFSSTRFKGLEYCPAYLSAGDTVVIKSLPLRNHEIILESINKQFKSRGVTALYAPAEEWRLKAAGILDISDSINNKLLLANGITHVLDFQQGYTKSGTFYNYEFDDPFRKNDPYYIRPNDEDDYVVELEIRLQAIKARQEYRFRVTTDIGGAEIKDDDDGATSINFGSIERAINIAIKKSAKRIAKNCR